MEKMLSIIYAFITLIFLSFLGLCHANQPEEKKDDLLKPMQLTTTQQHEEHETLSQQHGPFLGASIMPQEHASSSEGGSTLFYSGPQCGLEPEEIEYLFKSSTNFVCIFEVGGKLQRINSAWHEVLGWDAQTLLDTPYINFVHPDDIEKTLAYEKKITPTGLVNRYQCKDGSYRWLDWIGVSRLREPKSSKAEGFPLAVARDVTLVKKLESEFLKDKIKESEEKWHIKQQVLETIADIQSCHLNIIKSFGRSNKEDKSKAFKVILDSLIKLSKSDFGFVGEAIKKEDEIHIEYTWDINKKCHEKTRLFIEDTEAKTKLEKIFHMLLTDVNLIKEPFIINNIRDYPDTVGLLSPKLPGLTSFLVIPLKENSNLLGIVGLSNREGGYEKELVDFLDPLIFLSSSIMHELNIMKLTKKQLKIHKQALENSQAKDALKSRFVAHMSHELRTPLTGMLGMLDLIDESNIKGKDLRYLQIAKKSGKSLLSVINDILDMSKIEAGQFKLESIKFNPLTVVQDVIETLSPEFQEKGVEIDFKHKFNFPSNLVGDAGRLRQIFFNLIGNAIKFTSKGSVCVDLGYAPGSQENQVCLVGDVSDTGIGISPEDQERLFKPFMQVEETKMERQVGGTGLGLYITKELCKMMNGEISVSSEIGRGSTFHFTVFMEKYQEPKPQQEVDIKLPIERPIDKLPNIRVLVVEDNKVAQTILKTLLTRTESSVDIAENGEQAITACLSNLYDVVLMDGEMPVMDGITATKKLRETFDRETLPIIGLTAHALTREREKFLEAGTNCCLTKPIRKDVLFKEIMNCLTRARRCPS